MDELAQIAARGIGGRPELLMSPEPIPHASNVCNLEETQSAPIQTVPKMSTKEELSEALVALREQYRPFLRNLAPAIKSYRKRVDMKSFMRDGELVHIPEYGGPFGKCKKVYTTEVEVPEFSEDQMVYIHFEGADYRAVVSVNGSFAGEHIGFFSPFEFEITDLVKQGKNQVQVELYNDYVYKGNGPVGKERVEGDKLYAATGLGWDDPAEGWHHCPPGMGIYNDVYVEVREKVHITDLYVRPMKDRAEVWVEIESDSYQPVFAEVIFSVYGQNFSATVFENKRYIPETVRTVGLGDSLTEAEVKADLGKGIPMPLKHGKNVYKIPFDMPEAKIWDLETPYLYQVQVAVEVRGSITDCQSVHFGMREFVQDTEGNYNPLKGMFYLNGRPIRLRGANTMGFEQQDVLRGDYDQLIDDLLLAKLCNMNYLRLTQRPVQTQVYDYCDMLGMMTQSDLPLFGCMRRFHVPEGIRQAEEMERHVRKHPCNVVVTYINEPFPNAYNSPHRHLLRDEMEAFFGCCDMVVKMQNPDRVIKHVDGDYDPPTEGMPDNHCYPMWYNGHGIDIGRLHKGHWLMVKPGWYYGCGEYGAEGLDCAEVMREDYPAEWLTEPFHPGHIVGAQTGDFHYFFFDTQTSLEDWVEQSQAYQAFATKMMTEAFRRDDRMISCAIHLFIDAWPSGWMKTIMDHRRNPKPAFFAYRDALQPVHVSLRTDRFSYTVGEEVRIEAYLCNDTAESRDYTLHFELYNEAGKLVKRTECPVTGKLCGAKYAAEASFMAELFQDTKDRSTLLLKAVLMDGTKVVDYAEQKLEIFADVSLSEEQETVFIYKLPIGTHEIAGETVTVKPCGMLPVHFVSRATGHPAVAEFQEKDFSYWYNAEEDMITPILETTFTAGGFTPILTSGNMDAEGNWEPVLAAAEKYDAGKRYVICQVDLRTENPVAKRFLRNVLGE